jgi:hypothetical protein
MRPFRIELSYEGFEAALLLQAVEARRPGNPSGTKKESTGRHRSQASRTPCHRRAHPPATKSAMPMLRKTNHQSAAT